MLIRGSAKFRNQYPHELEFGIPASKPFPQTWNVDILPNGPNQIVVLCSEEQTLFPILIATSRARKLAPFLDFFRERLLRFSKRIKTDVLTADAQNPFTFAKRINRSIIGSQNEQLFNVWYRLQESRKPASPQILLKIERELHEMPMSVLDMNCPIDALHRKTGHAGIA